MRIIFCDNCNHICNNDMVKCPKCHNKNLRTAQQGGIGGQPHPYQPGSSPRLYKEKGGGSQYFAADIGLDALMGINRPQNNALDMPLEQQLESFHELYQEDIIPYLLTQPERMKLKEKEAEIRHQNFNKEFNKSIKENSVENIKKHNQVDIKHITPLEQLLEQVRVYDDERTSIYDDQIIIDPPTRLMPVASIKKAIKIRRPNTVFMNPEYDDDYNNNLNGRIDPRMNPMQHIYQSNFVPPMISQNDVINYLGDEADAEIKFLGQATKGKNLIDYIPADSIVNNEKPYKESQLSYTNKNNSINSTLERNLNNTNRGKINNKYYRLPQDPYSYWSEYETKKGKLRNDAMGIPDTYSGFGAGSQYAGLPSTPLAHL